jgi:hypothetical protein
MTWWQPTGRRWRRPPRQCPDWCGGGHLCTAQHGYPTGEHRSLPLRVVTAWGVLVATRVQSITDTASRLEVRLQVGLSADEQFATVEAVRVAEEVDQAVRVALATAAGWVDVGQLDFLRLPGSGR